MKTPIDSMTWGENLWSALSDLKLPTLGRDAEIAVYLIHNSRNPEDYFFLFDFEEFVDRSEGGMFVRPVLRVFAGRDDFSRSDFARQFREVFAHEFDRMRAAVSVKKKGSGGWLDWGLSAINPLDILGSLVSTLVLAIALSAGKHLLGNLAMPKMLRKKTAEAKLADEIERTKEKVETALQRIEITVHRELYDHAYRGGPLGKISDLGRAAWPLPAHVKAHMEDNESGSWW